ncbi:monocarboxylate transporter 9-like isoform X2 [Dermacentor albipictus]|uniref:monocarboxylate transporter 9-like isoform X2 n=1 Tax=Dermacentor albipictus TaxID=60249 RepID=UPI0038FC4690
MFAPRRLRPLQRSARRVAAAARCPPLPAAMSSTQAADGRRGGARQRRKAGPDSRYSWVVALACGGVNVFMHASGKVVGLLFSGMLHEFAVSRETAAWPLVLNNTLLNVAAPAFGFLSKFFPIRNIILLSSAISSVSVALCFFISDVFYISLLFGVIHGAATCGAVLMTQVCINQHFIRRRGTAAGVVSAISSLNCVIFPPLYEYWVSHYDLHWSFLLLGACILNSMAFGLLVRSPSWLIVNPVDYSKRRKSIFTRANVADKGLASWITHFSEDNSDSSDEEGHLEASRHLSGSVRYFFSEGGGISTSDSQPQMEMMPVVHRSSVAPLSEEAALEVGPVRQAHQLLIRSPDPLVTIPTGYTLCKPLEPARGGHFQLKHDEGDTKRKFWKNAKTFLTVSFWHLTLSQFLVQFGLGVFLLTIIDFANDCGIGAKDSVFFMTSFCIGDMLSRVVTGLIADRGSVHLEFLVALAYVLQGVCYEFMCYIKGYLYLLLLTLGIGISHGSRIFLLPIFLTRSFGLGGLSVNLSVATCICGVLALLRPFLIGYFRDQQGTYKGLYHLICIVNMAVAVTWFIKMLLIQ